MYISGSFADGSMLFFQAEDGIRDLVRSRGLGDVYKRQADGCAGRARAIVDWVWRSRSLAEALDAANVPECTDLQ